MIHHHGQDHDDSFAAKTSALHSKATVDSLQSDVVCDRAQLQYNFRLTTTPQIEAAGCLLYHAAKLLTISHSMLNR